MSKDAHCSPCQWSGQLSFGEFSNVFACRSCKAYSRLITTCDEGDDEPKPQVQTRSRDHPETKEPGVTDEQDDVEGNGEITPLHQRFRDESADDEKESGVTDEQTDVEVNGDITPLHQGFRDETVDDKRSEERR